MVNLRRDGRLSVRRGVVSGVLSVTSPPIHHCCQGNPYEAYDQHDGAGERCIERLSAYCERVGDSSWDPISLQEFDRIVSSGWHDEGYNVLLNHGYIHDWGRAREISVDLRDDQGRGPVQRGDAYRGGCWDEEIDIRLGYVWRATGGRSRTGRYLGSDDQAQTYDKKNQQ